MRTAGVLASGENPPSTELVDAQSVFNLMLEGWSAERLQVFTITRSVFNFIPNKQTYTCGTGGDFNIPRPAEIKRWSPISNVNPQLPIELPADDPLTDDEWRDIRSKDTASLIPRQMYDDGAFPLRNLSFWPIPTDGTYQVALYSWTLLSELTDPNIDLSFPPGYLEAIKYNLAMRIAAEWPGQISEATAELARTSLARIRSLNLPVVKLKCDPAVASRDGGHYNWLIDEYQR